MKKFFFMAVAAIAALSSCSNDNDPIIDGPSKKALTFTATMEGDETRATYDSGNKCASWEAGDKISINGVEYVAQEGGLTTTFQVTNEDEDVLKTPYNAYFACQYDGTTATLPANITETWADGKFNMPMYATSVNTELYFRNLCGVLKITVKSDQISAVKKIRVSSTNLAICGDFTVSNGAAVLTNPTVNGNTLTVTYKDAIKTDETGKVFYVAVPAQTYQQLKIELSADGTNFIKSMTTKSGTNVAIARNKIYPITFANNSTGTTGTATAKIGDNYVDVKWVQLWAGGPKFAEYNVGVTDGKAVSYGGYYRWGGIIDVAKNQSQYYDTGNNVLTNNNDAATQNWGSNWRMPTSTELDNLRTKCTATWRTNYNGSGKNGYLFTGKTSPYTSYSLFLPAAGYYGYTWTNNSNGYYWTSTPIKNNAYAYHLEFGFSNFSSSYYIEVTSNNLRDNGYSVRAVLK